MMCKQFKRGDKVDIIGKALFNTHINFVGKEGIVNMYFPNNRQHIWVMVDNKPVSFDINSIVKCECDN